MNSLATRKIGVDMNIYTVRDNLKNTIAGKEAMLKGVAKDTTYGKIIEQMLEFNIDELKRILQDVEQCCEKATEQSWRDSPDRMGGQFTQDEIDNSTKW